MYRQYSSYREEETGEREHAHRSRASNDSCLGHRPVVYIFRLKGNNVYISFEKEAASPAESTKRLILSLIPFFIF
jgi:hypothetical protein